MVDQLAAEYAAAGKPALFLEQNVDNVLGSRADRWWAAHGGGGVYLPLVMVDSGNWISNNYLGAAAHDTYAGMVDDSLARPPGAEIVATHKRIGNSLHFAVRVTNRSGFALSGANETTIHAVVYEEHTPVSKDTDHITGRIVRAVASKVLTTSIAVNATATVALGTIEITTVVDWANVKAVVLLDYLENSGKYDMLQAVVSTVGTPPAGVLFSDDFSDGTAAGDPEWNKKSGRWTVTSGRYKAISTRAANISVPMTVPPRADGIVQAAMAMSTVASSTPNAMLVFGYQSPSSYRYVRIVPGGIRVGQVGTYGGVGPGVKKSKPITAVTNKLYAVRATVKADGSVQVYFGGKLALTYAFPGGSVSGAFGLGASRAAASFDNFVLRALP